LILHAQQSNLQVYLFRLPVVWSRMSCSGGRHAAYDGLGSKGNAHAHPQPVSVHRGGVRTRQQTLRCRQARVSAVLSENVPSQVRRLRAATCCSLLIAYTSGSPYTSGRLDWKPPWVGNSVARTRDYLETHLVASEKYRNSSFSSATWPTPGHGKRPP
jgi:hypothetical protein